jgi:hypothetical protein
MVEEAEEAEKAEDNVLGEKAAGGAQYVTVVVFSSWLMLVRFVVVV